MTRKELAYQIAHTLYRYSYLDINNFATYTDCIDETTEIILDFLNAHHLTILDTDYLQSFIEEHLVQ